MEFVEFEITNHRAELEAQWLRQRFTDAQLQAAFAELRRRGSQRTYPVNIARVLGVKLPTEAELLASTPEARARAQAARADALARLDARRRQPTQPAQTFRDWLRMKHEAGEAGIPGDDPVFDYAETVGIPRDFLVLHWREFKARFMQSDKRHTDWREEFRKSVRGNWFGLWVLREDDAEATLTTAGVQAMRVMRAEEDR